MQLIIDTSDTTLTVRNRCFLISKEETEHQISPLRVSSIAIYSNCKVSSSAIVLAAQNQVPLLFFNRLGKVQARTWSPYHINLSSVRRQQLQFCVKPEATAYMVRTLQLKTALQQQLLKRFAGRKPSAGEQTAMAIASMTEKTKDMEGLVAHPMSEVRSTLFGLEGNISKEYFRAMQPFLPEAFRFGKRSRRPAKDMYNAALNYLYGMTYTHVESAILATGLDPMCSILHVENYKRPTLVFDLIEPFRPLVDGMLISLC